MNSAPAATAQDSPAVAVHDSIPQQALTANRSDLSASTYWLLSSLLILTYLGFWLYYFPYVYGWLMDDRTVFIKGSETVQNWKAAFGYYNALHTYFFLISYLPIWLDVKLPSYPIPIFGERTGNFRFLLLWAMCLHVVMLFFWAWFAPKVTRQRLVAVLSLLLLATSPTFVLWTPLPESRLLGMPFVLLGMWWLFKDEPGAPLTRRNFKRNLLAGLMFGVAQSIHYTSLYLIAPFCVVYWGYWLFSLARSRAYWRDVIAFGLGCLWIPAIFEAISFFAVGTSFAKGPLMTLVGLRHEHGSHWTRSQNLAAWGMWFRSQMGLALLSFIVVGAIMFFYSRRLTDRHVRATRTILSATIPLGILYVCLSGSMPFFRQTSVLQPFMFLMAAWAIVHVAFRLARPRAARVACIAAMVIPACWVQWDNAWAVFKAHQSVGRAVAHAHENKPLDEITWLQVAWFNGKPEVGAPVEFNLLNPESWVISYFPWTFDATHSSWRPHIEAAPVVGSWRTLFSTAAIKAELNAYWFNDFASEPILGDIRILRLKDLLRTASGKPLQVVSVTADSQGHPGAEPVNVFDHDESPDQGTFWMSNVGPGPHYLEIHFADSTPLTGVDIVIAPRSGPTSRIEEMEVLASTGKSDFHSLWRASGLSNRTVVQAQWPNQPIRQLKLVFYRMTHPLDVHPATIVEEVVFPGYFVHAPRPTRSLPELRLTSIAVVADGLRVEAEQLAPCTVVVGGGRRLPLKKSFIDGSTIVPAEYLPGAGDSQFHLEDAFRTSNAVVAHIPGPPTLQRIDPPFVEAGVAFAPQADRCNAISVSCQDVVPGTTVLVDGIPIRTYFGNDHWLTANVPPGVTRRAGTKTITLKNAFGESAPVEWVIRPPLSLTQSMENE